MLHHCGRLAVVLKKIIIAVGELKSGIAFFFSGSYGDSSYFQVLLPCTAGTANVQPLRF